MVNENIVKGVYYYEVSDSHSGEIIAKDYDDALESISEYWNINKKAIQIQYVGRHYGE